MVEVNTKRIVMSIIIREDLHDKQRHGDIVHS